MATFHYALKRKGQKRLKIIWESQNLRVLLDEIEIANVPGKTADLQNGYKFPLPDGSILSIQIVTGFPLPQLQINRNDFPLPGSPSDPYPKINRACGAAFILGGLYAAIGSFLFFRYPVLLGSTILGVILLILGAITLTRKSFWALLLAVLLHIIFLTIPNILTLNKTLTGGFLPTADVLFRFYLVFEMMMGLQPLWFLKTFKQKMARQTNLNRTTP